LRDQVSKKKPVSRVRATRQKRSSGDPGPALLKLVRAGVERFVLRGAPIEVFQKAVREASRAGHFSAHPLSGTEFRRIVKAAVGERKRARAGRPKSKRITRKGNRT
jgi:hypothetical protein